MSNSNELLSFSPKPILSGAAHLLSSTSTTPLRPRQLRRAQRRRRPVATSGGSGGDITGHFSAASAAVTLERLKFLESERADLLRECNTLRSEKKWLSEKTARLEKCLRLTEAKHARLKTSQEDHRRTVARLEDALASSKKVRQRDEANRDKNFLELNARFRELLSERDKSLERVKLLEERLDIFRRSAEESERSRRNYFNDFTNAKLEKEYIAAKLGKALREKTVAEKERDEYKLTLEGTRRDVLTLRSKDSSNDEKIQAVSNVLRQRKQENESISHKLRKYRHKVQKYKRRLGESRSTREDLRKQVDALRARRQRDDPVITSRQKLIDRLTRELRATKDRAESTRAENAQLKSLVGRLNLFLAESERNKKLLRRDMELKDKDLSKRNKFIGAILRSHIGGSLVGGAPP